MTWTTNKFTDVSQFPVGSSSNMRVWERQLLCCVPVPGQNSCYLMARQIYMPRQQAERSDRETTALFHYRFLIYDTPESDLKLNDVFEFIGVLTFDTDVENDNNGEHELEHCFDQEELVNLPPSKVPRLHCLVHRKLSPDDLIIKPPTMEPKPHLVKEICQSLLHHLTVILGGDDLAANFILLHLLSKIQRFI